MNRMNCLLLAVSALVFTAMSGQTAVANDPYGVVFNCDGHSVFVQAKGSVDPWIENILAHWRAVT